MYQHQCADYDFAIEVLQSLYVTPPNEILAHHLLVTRIPKPGKSLDNYLNALTLLSKDCKFKAVSAENYRKDLIRDAFIN